MERIENIKRHFEEEAQQYDGLISRLIPYYHQMVEAVVKTLPYERSDEIEVLDLGCGTGTIARAVKDAFPKAKMTCLDIAQNMLGIAASKLSDAPDTTYLCNDFYHFEFDQQYDAVVSSLALHHLETLDDKLSFYRKIYNGLNSSGIFINADLVLASTEFLQKQYLEQWKRFMCSNVPKDEVDNNWILRYYAEDRPATMIAHMEMLEKAGFTTMDVVWKYYNFAVYMGGKEGDS